MASDEDVKRIELRRLAELEKQAALFGPQTEPSILIEIADLRNKYPRSAPTYSAERRSNAALDYEFLMNVVAAALQRLTVIETLVLGEKARRPFHQAVNMAFNVLVVAMLIYALFLR